MPSQKRIVPSDRRRVENFSPTSPVDTPLIARQIKNTANANKRNLSTPEYRSIASTVRPLDAVFPLSLR
jgi:hypothetical protein